MSPRTVRLAAALAALLLAPAARAYVRSTSREGAPFYWQERKVGYQINPRRGPSAPSCSDASQYADTAAIEAVRAAFRTWTGAVQDCTDLELLDQGFTDVATVGFDPRAARNENLVIFREGWCSEVALPADACWDSGTCANTYDCFEDALPADRATIAITTVTHDAHSGRIYDADIELADWRGQLPAGSSLSPGGVSTQPPDGWYFTCTPAAQPPCSAYGQSGCTYVDLQSNATHEIGHFIGLAHPCTLGNSDCNPKTSVYRPLVMFPAATLGDVSKRTLTDDDRAGLCAIYPFGGATWTSPVKASGGGGCASGGGAGGLASALLALVALARRGRRR
ncbi:zinc metalloprotease [Anaeromyxobacter terrae]|uniref:peptidase M10 n=1 Tax=Anaeromyxobacter terrae TaxID=2925406 RepID=UPI001F5678B6|nr:peptidase M10 [Anaeromyxobacter sp. SG22]